MNRGEETLSRVVKFEETSTVNKRLATANLFSCGEWRLFYRPPKLHVTTLMRSRLSSFQTGRTAALGFVETASLLGTSLEHSLLLQASERKSSNAYTLISPFYE
ncbi:hypothetical protein CRENBAI_015059 [Crenichthys baileyi]|uniref:Uncharacterized protein n=1 Tax=Crenichthys baileyi TaxID=28760 RepID=A0AAV9R0B7_9TELE